MKLTMRWLAGAVAALVLACAPYSGAQDQNAQRPDGEIDGIAHVAYRVSNLDNELAFLKKLGYEE